MRKSLFVFILLLALFSLSKTGVSAALVEVDDKGNIRENVLSYNSKNDLMEESDIEVKQIAQEGTESDSNISLTNTDGKISLVIGNQKELDVTDFNYDLVELEERPKVKRIKVSHKGEDFIITQEGYQLKTNYPIVIDPLDNTISVVVGDKNMNLALLPGDIARSTLRTNLINEIGEDPFQIVLQDGDLFYQVKGNKLLSFSTIYDLRIPITAKLSASSGKLTSLDDPQWIKFLSILFI